MMLDDLAVWVEQEAELCCWWDDQVARSEDIKQKQL